MLVFLPQAVRHRHGFAGVEHAVLVCSLAVRLALVKLVRSCLHTQNLIDPVLNTIVCVDRVQQRLDAVDANSTRWDVWGVDALTYAGWYLVNCNHQSWVDIFVLQHPLNWRIPLLKFFFSTAATYVPVIGLAWWALDFPFMKRHSNAALRKHPSCACRTRRPPAAPAKSLRWCPPAQVMSR